jgi:DNA-binding transcriptional LysR family regulator
MHQHKIDIGLFFSVHGQSDISDKDLLLHTLYENGLYYCYANIHPLANLGRPVQLSDVEAYTLTGSPTPDIDTEAYGLNFFQSTNIRFLLDLVSEGVLVGIFPEAQAKQLFKNNSNIILTPMRPPYFEEIKSSVLVGYLQQNKQNPLIDLFVKELNAFYRF